MADLRFARHTNAILEALPHWFSIRKESKDSIGARFLNICGLELDDARYVIDYAYQQCYIATADIDQVDFCYKAIVPMPLKVKNVDAVFANHSGLIKAENLKQFFGVDQNGIRDVNVHSFEFYYTDDDRNIIYVRKKFNADAINNDGKIVLKFGDKEYTLKLQPHHVWNFFDELGALVSCPRIPEEPNFEYQKRIMDVFMNKANASRDGLINGIGRELALRRNLMWNDTTRDLELQDSMIVLNSIKVNEEYFDQSRIYISERGTVILKAVDETSNPVPVTYVHGLEMHQLYNINGHEIRNVNMLLGGRMQDVDKKFDVHYDIKLYNELFTVEGKAKERLRRYIEILNQESPIFWDSFHWNEHYWDMNEKDVSGVGFIPHLYDGSIRGFRKYARKKA